MGTTVSYCLSPCCALMLHPLQQQGGQSVMRHNREKDGGSWGDAFQAVFIEHRLTQNRQLAPENKSSCAKLYVLGNLLLPHWELRGYTIITGQIQSYEQGSQAAVCWCCDTNKQINSNNNKQAWVQHCSSVQHVQVSQGTVAAVILTRLEIVPSCTSFTLTVSWSHHCRGSSPCDSTFSRLFGSERSRSPSVMSSESDLICMKDNCINVSWQKVVLCVMLEFKNLVKDVFCVLTEHKLCVSSGSQEFTAVQLLLNILLQFF